MSSGELFVIASLIELEKEFESYDLADDVSTVCDGDFRRVRVEQNKQFRENSFNVSLDTRYTALEARLALRAECIQGCLIREGSDMDEDGERLFTMEIPELLNTFARLQERAAAAVKATEKPRSTWLGLWRKNNT